MPDDVVSADYNGGLVLDFFDSLAYELQEDTCTDALARDYVRMHMLPWEECTSRVWVSRRIQSALVYQYDAEFIRAVRQVYHDGFLRVFSQLRAREVSRGLTHAQNNQAELYISNCLTALPFTDPTPYECFKFPQLVEGRWTLVDYTVQPIELSEIGCALDNQVFAYGFSPLVERRVPSHLVFPATTYLAGRGFWRQMRANMAPFATAGRDLYESGQERVGTWLDEQNRMNRIKTQAHGNSQGGALTLQLAIHQGDKVSKAYALNPPGLYKLYAENDAFDRWHKEDYERPFVCVQENAGDWVHTYGKRKHEWLRLYVEPPVISGISALDHASNFAGRRGVKIINKCSRQANEERDRSDVWVYARFRAFCLYALYWPYVNIIRPVQVPFLMMLSGLLLCSLLPTLLTMPVLTVVAVVSLIFAALDLYAYWTREYEVGDPHRRNVPRLASMDMYHTEQSADYALKHLGEYYHVKRELIHHKQTHESTNSHVRFFKADGSVYRKSDLLKDSQQSFCEATFIHVKATRAKHADIRDTLAHLGQEDALREQEANYQFGKVVAGA